MLEVDMLGMQSIVIYPSRKKIFGLMLVNVVLGSASFISGNAEWLLEFRPATAKLLLYGGTAFFSITTAVTLFRLIIQKPEFIISNEGIADHSSLFSPGMIPWNEIDRVFYQKKGTDEFWGIALKKPEEFQKKQPFWKKLKRKSGRRTDAAIVSIPQKQLPLSIGEFLKQIRAAHPEVRVHYPFAIIENGSK